MTCTRHNAVYNSPIPEMLTRSPRFPRLTCSLLLTICFLTTSVSYANDWASPEQELARKIAAATGPGAIALDVMNRSSLTKKDVEQISQGLRVQLEALGARTVKPEQAASTVQVSLSENLQSYVWVAEIHQGAGDFSVA